MRINCGIDWSERHHDFALVDDDGAVVAKKRVGTGVEGFAELLATIAEQGAEVEDMSVAIETDKGLLVAALQGAGFGVRHQPASRRPLSRAARLSRWEVRPR